ncbi:MAG: GGDEF domain-containing protein [Treponema sp.]|nr:GGDEF domain-containing protein [Treponema sp.]
MKKIGVIIPTFNIEYSTEFLHGIYDYFDGKDVSIIYTQTKLPHSTVGVYDYQYWQSAELLFSQEIDALIIATGVYCAGMTQEELESELYRFGRRPVISTAIPLNLPNCYTVQADCKKSYLEVITHLKNVHGCRNIAFLSAAETKSREAIERFEAFKEAMSANKLKVNDKFVFEGKFTDFDAEAALKKTLKTKSDVKFDAMVCANDMMAIGCYRVLKELGLSVPNDVKVVGFDDAQFANRANPRLSTINQNIYNQGYVCAQTAFSVLNGEEVPRIINSDLETKFRQSCGCIPLDSSEDVYRSPSGEIKEEGAHLISRLNQYMNDLEERNNIIILLDILKGANTMRQFYYNLKYIIHLCAMDNMAINLYQMPVYLDYNEDVIVPEKMELNMYSDIISNKEEFNPGTKFNPSNIIFSEPSLDNIPGQYILHPIFTGETCYGYLICKINKNKFADYTIYLKILINAICSSIEYTNRLMETERLTNKYTELKEDNTSLTKQSKTDELTGLLNRRGYYEFGQRTLDIIQEMEHAGIVFFADMDNLKKINDTYGHDAGDEAIKLLAEVFKSVFRNNDVIGRLGGDEFGIVAPGMIIEHVPLIRKKIDETCKKESKRLKLPYTLSVSVGYASLEKSSLLKQLMSEADVMLYAEKRKKHGRKYT